MIVSSLVFYAILAVIALMIFGIFLFIERKYNKPDFKIYSSFGIVPVVVLLIWQLPNIYIIKSCSESERKVMIFPTKGFSYGSGKCYVINESKEKLGIETFVYGNAPEKEIIERSIDTTVAPGTTATIPKGEISYLLEPAPESVSTKSSYEFKHRLYCNSDKDVKKEDDEPGAYSND